MRASENAAEARWKSRKEHPRRREPPNSCSTGASPPLRSEHDICTGQRYARGGGRAGRGRPQNREVRVGFRTPSFLSVLFPKISEIPGDLRTVVKISGQAVRTPERSAMMKPLRSATLR